MMSLKDLQLINWVIKSILWNLKIKVNYLIKTVKSQVFELLVGTVRNHYKKACQKENQLLWEKPKS